MRKLTWAATGYAAAALLAEYALPVSELPYFAAALVLCGVALLTVRRWKKRNRAIVCLMAAAVGLFAWGFHYVRHAQPCEELVGQRLPVAAEVTDYPREKDGYYSLEVKIREGAPRERGILYAYGDTAPDLVPGDIITAEIRVASAIRSGGERRHYYTAEGQFLRGYLQDDPLLIGKAGHLWRYFPQVLARNVKALCEDVFSGDTAPFMKALLTGDTDDLKKDEGLYACLRAAGVLHVVAVSGMHLMVLIEMVQLFFGRSRRTSLLCFPLMAVFVLMAGCRPSVVRAAVMQFIVLLAPLVEREHDKVTGLSAAALAILIPNPMAIGGVGFQLSFACVLGLEILVPRFGVWMQNYLPMEKRLVRDIGNSISGSVAAVVFSMPVSAYYFGTIPLLSVLANLLTLTIVEICFGAGYALCALGFFAPEAAALGGWVLDWGVRWCLLVYRFLGALPFACLYTAKMLAVWWLVGVYALWIGWYALRRRGRGFSPLIPGALCAVGLGVVLLCSTSSLRQEIPEVSVLDVEQGQCVVLTEGAAAVIVDCGGSGLDNAGDLAANHLLSSGRSRVDVLILTHLHDDHTNGVKTLMGRMPVETVILPAGADDEDGALDEILAAAEKAGARVVQLTEPCGLELGNISLSMYLPRAGTNENERGIVISADIGTKTALIMGDAGTEAETELLSAGVLPDADILIVGHHGSKSASGALFLRAVQAETAVISVGDNSYGLPREEILMRLEEYETLVRRTDEEGTITIQTETDG